MSRVLLNSYEQNTVPTLVLLENPALLTLHAVHCEIPLDL